MRQIVLDTETTGLSPQDGHRIIEVAGVELENRRLTGRQFHQYIKVDRDIDIGAQKVHGITRDFLADKPYFSDIIEELLQFINGAELVIHNAPFDVGFLNHEFKLLDREIGVVHDYCQILDTLALARKMHPGQRNSLDALCKRYDIDNTNRELHGALIDADLLALTYLAMTSGQENLFAEPNKQQKNNNQNLQQPVQRITGSLNIIYASDEELNAHQKYLTTIESQAGECLWQQEVSL